MLTSNVVILLIGLQRSGKTTFTRAVTKADREPSRLKEAYETTGTCQRYEAPYKGNRFTIIDTPGFADKGTPEENIKVLEQIASELGKMGQQSIGGIIYLHNVQHVRLTSADKTNFRILRAICGEPFFPHVAFVTTHWDCIKLSEEQCDTINHHLEMEREDFLPKSPRTFKFLNDGESHKRVLDHFTTQINTAAPAPLPQLLFAEELKKYHYERKPLKAVKKTAARKQMAAEHKKVSKGFLSCSIL